MQFTPEIRAQLEARERAEEYFAAIEILEPICSAQPEDLELRFRLAVHVLKVGQVERALEMMRACVADGFVDPVVYLNLGHGYKAMGRYDEAAENYMRLVDSDNETHAAIGYWSLADLKNFRFSRERYDELIMRIAAKDITPGDEALMQFAAGYAHEQYDRLEDAFKAMVRGNNIVAANRPFKADGYGRLINSLVSNVKGGREVAEIEGPTPILIVGMPRSGTTLVEQVLASHSQVESTDELPFLNRIGLELEKGGGYAATLDNLSRDRLEHYARSYLAQVEPYRHRKVPCFIDKNPTNFMNIGLVMALFPNAKVINVVRDPLDNAMSMYKQYFFQGNDFSYSMNGIIYYWQGYLTVMRHWLELFPGRILNFGYENFTRDPEAGIRTLLEFCNLDIEAECFRFYESDRPVLTPSASQVRNPVSRSSVGSGLKYEAFMGDYIPGLAEVKARSREILGV